MKNKKIVFIKTGKPIQKGLPRAAGLIGAAYLIMGLMALLIYLIK